jgi:hypothetical protein
MKRASPKWQEPRRLPVAVAQTVPLPCTCFLFHRGIESKIFRSEQAAEMSTSIWDPYCAPEMFLIVVPHRLELRHYL